MEGEGRVPPLSSLQYGVQHLSGRMPGSQSIESGLFESSLLLFQSLGIFVLSMTLHEMRVSSLCAVIEHG